MNDYVVVTAVSSHRIRYVMHKDDLRKLNTSVKPTDKELAVWAMDTVTMEECEEFSQLYLGEQIVDVTEGTEEEIIDLCNKDNDYFKEWDRDYKIQWIRKCLKKPEPQERYHDYISKMYREMEKENAEQAE